MKKKRTGRSYDKLTMSRRRAIPETEWHVVRRMPSQTDEESDDNVCTAKQILSLHFLSARAVVGIYRNVTAIPNGLPITSFLYGTADLLRPQLALKRACLLANIPNDLKKYICGLELILPRAIVLHKQDLFKMLCRMLCDVISMHHDYGNSAVIFECVKQIYDTDVTLQDMLDHPHLACTAFLINDHRCSYLINASSDGITRIASAGACDIFDSHMPYLFFALCGKHNELADLLIDRFGDEMWHELREKYGKRMKDQDYSYERYKINLHVWAGYKIDLTCCSDQVIEQLLYDSCNRDIIEKHVTVQPEVMKDIMLKNVTDYELVKWALQYCDVDVYSIFAMCCADMNIEYHMLDGLDGEVLWCMLFASRSDNRSVIMNVMIDNNVNMSWMFVMGLLTELNCYGNAFSGLITCNGERKPLALRQLTDRDMSVLGGCAVNHRQRCQAIISMLKVIYD